MFIKTKSMLQNVRYLPNFFLTPEVLRRVLTSYISKSIGNFKIGLPLNVNLMITPRCNLHCRICYVKDELKKNNKEEMTLKDIKKIQQTFKGKKTFFFLTGGEPTLRKDFLEIIKILKKDKRHFCGFVTNGTILDNEKIDNLIKTKVDFVVFSIFGNPDLHSNMTGDKNSYKKLVRNIDYLCHKKKDTYVLLNAPISNDLDFLNLVEKGSEMGVDGIRFSHLTYVTEDEYKKARETLHESQIVTNYNHNKINTDSLIRKIRETKKIQTEIDVLFHPYLSEKDIKEWYSDDFKQKRRCHILQTSVHIGYDGNVHPCKHYKLNYGNIKKEEFMEIWNSKKAIDFRKKIDKELLPTCKRCIRL